MIRSITYQEAVDFLLPKHYSGRKPQISHAFGWFIDGVLVAVCTFGKPASYTLCNGVCGKEFSKYVIELNRLCRVDGVSLNLSHFISYCLKNIPPSIVVSYADTAMNHHGYIYQACNFLYTGCTKARTERYVQNGKHSRHYEKELLTKFRVCRSSKHRYIFFTGSKHQKKEFKKNLKYNVLPYPKGDNSNYILGNFLERKILDTENGVIFSESRQE